LFTSLDVADNIGFLPMYSVYFNTIVWNFSWLLISSVRR